jgi:hypothetical protein
MKEKKFMRDCNWKTKLNKIKLLQKKIKNEKKIKKIRNEIEKQKTKRKIMPFI